MSFRAAANGQVSVSVLCTNAGGVNITLNLDASVLSQIFTCSITNYNNASIKALNPGIE